MAKVIESSPCGDLILEGIEVGGPVADVYVDEVVADAAEKRPRGFLISVSAETVMRLSRCRSCEMEHGFREGTAGSNEAVGRQSEKLPPAWNLWRR